MAVSDCSVPLASVSVSEARRRRRRWWSASTGSLCAALEIWPSASCVEDSRAETSPLESTMPFSRSRSRSKETDWPVRAPSARPMSATRAGRDFLLRLGQLALRAQQRIAHRLGDRRGGDEGRSSSPYLTAIEKRRQHVVDRLDQPRRGLVGVLEIEQQRHLHVDVDAGRVGQRLGRARRPAPPWLRPRWRRPCARLRTS